MLAATPAKEVLLLQLSNRLTPPAASLLATLLLGIIVAVAWWAGQQTSMAGFGLSTLSLALFLGMLIGNLVRLPEHMQPMLHVARHHLLRLGVMLFGLHIGITQLLDVGGRALAINLIVMGVILSAGIWIGIRIFRLEPALAVMTAAGSAICGAAAVLAAEPVVRGERAHTSMAIASVVLFGSLAMVIYPQIYQLFAPGDARFGIYIGATVHEVAQVVAIGQGIDAGTEETAVIVKLMRVMMLAPALLLLSLWWRRGQEASGRLTVPWFAFGFIAVVGFNSLELLPRSLHEGLIGFDTLLLATAMAALGLETRLAQVRQLGIRPLAFAGLLFLALTLGGGLLTRLLA